MNFTAKQLNRYQRNPAAFIEECLYDPETGRPFVLLPVERAFINLAFKTDATGRLIHPELVYAAPKKSGKTGFAALMMLTMILLFGGKYAEGYCVANDQEQAQGRVHQAVRRIVECSPLLADDAEITRDKITFPKFGSASITAIASDFAGAAGANPTISTFDELWGYTSERSRRLWDEMVPPPTRKITCRLTTTYAGFEGESVLLEELYKRGLAQPEIGPGLYAGDGILMSWQHGPIAPWQTEAWLAEMRRSLRPNAYLRLIENRFVSSESSFVDMAAWDTCVDPRMTPMVKDPELPIWVGVDASVKHDSTGIVAVTWDQGTQKVRLISHRVFQPSPDDPLDFETTIEATLLDLAGRFKIRKAIFDPYQMQPVAQRLRRAGIPIEEFPQSVGNLTSIGQNLYDLISGRNLVAYPDTVMRLAISRAVAIETSRGWRISKEKASHKIDVVVALAMACHAAVVKGVSAKVTWEIITLPLGPGDGPPGRSLQEFLKSEEASLSPDDLYRRRVLGPDWRNRLR
jgi:phage terminase large subunit-like protein